jgi:hypothetical protein
MNDQFFAAVAMALKAKGMTASVWESGGGILCLDVRQGDKVFIFGTSDDFWAADVYQTEADFEEFIEGGYVETTCPSDCLDANEVARAIAKASGFGTSKAINIYDAIGQTFAHLVRLDRHDELKNFPMDSVCGESVEEILAASAAMITACDPASHQIIYTAAQRAIDIVCFG